jgi:hypothetical protein
MFGFGKNQGLREEKVKLKEEICGLKKELTDLQINEGKIKEAHEREKRDLEHMIGLEKKRQEFEITSTRRETEVKVREENLTADKLRFGEEVKFQRSRFEEEVKYLKEMMGEILERLPKIKINKEL